MENLAVAAVAPVRRVLVAQTVTHFLLDFIFVIVALVKVACGSEQKWL